MLTVDLFLRQTFGFGVELPIIVKETNQANLQLLSDVSPIINLRRFRAYREASDDLPDDLALVHLFTGIDHGSNLSGAAEIGGMCSTDGSDSSLTELTSFLTALTVHEIGHSLGALHDEDIQACSDTDFLMRTIVTDSTQLDFSSCTIDSINNFLSQKSCFVDPGLQPGQGFLENTDIITTTGEPIALNLADSSGSGKFDLFFLILLCLYLPMKYSNCQYRFVLLND